LPARLLVLSHGAIRSLIGAHRPRLIAVTIFFATGFTSVAFAGERQDLARIPSMIYASGCGGCTSLSYAAPSPHADNIYRGYGDGPFAYANPETDVVTRSYYGASTQASPRDEVVHRTIKSRQVSGRSATPVPNIVMVNGQRVEIVPPDEVNSIDLVAADVPGLEQAEVRFAPLAATGRPTVLAQALAVMAGALAAVAVGLFLIRWRSVRI
jgi:hypothetical protein